MMRIFNDNRHDRMREACMDAIQAAPPVAATGWYFAGHSINEWLALFTIIYTILLILKTLKNWSKP